MFKKLALGCLAAVAITAVALFITWRQATRLPDWYVDSPGDAAELTPGPPESVDRGPRRSSPAPADPGPEAASPASSAPAGGAPAARRQASRPSGGPTSKAPSTRPAGGAVRQEPSPAPAAGAGAMRPNRVELSEPELNRLLLQSLDEHPRGQRLKRAVKGVHASIDSDRLEIGVVTNLADLGAAAESEREAKAVRRLARLAPWLGDRDVYLAVRGRPRVRDGHLVLGRDGELKVGAFTFDVAEFAGRLGVPDEKLDRGVELPLAGMTVEDVEVTGGSLILSLAEDR